MSDEADGTIEDRFWRDALRLLYSSTSQLGTALWSVRRLSRGRLPPKIAFTRARRAERGLDSSEGAGFVIGSENINGSFQKAVRRRWLMGRNEANSVFRTTAV